MMDREAGIEPSPPKIMHCSEQVVDLTRSSWLTIGDRWLSFAAAFVVAALGNRPIWMLSDSSRSFSWAFPQRYGPPFMMQGDRDFSLVRTAMYDSEMVYEAIEQDWSNNALVFVPDEGYGNRELLAIRQEAFDDCNLRPAQPRFEYLRAYGDGTHLLWVGVGKRAYEVEGVIDGAMRALLSGR